MKCGAVLNWTKRIILLNRLLSAFYTKEVNSVLEGLGIGRLPQTALAFSGKIYSRFVVEPFASTLVD